MTSKELHLLGTTIFSQRVDLVQGWVKQALACSRGDPERYCKILKWLLGQAIKVWGITTLPAKLDLQGALLQTDPADLAACIVISVGPRLTDEFIFAASSSFAPDEGRRSSDWVRLHKELGLATSLSPALEDLCLDRPVSQQQLQQLSAEERYHYLTVALTNPDPLSTNQPSLFLTPQEAVQGWSKQQVHTSLKLLMDAACDSVEADEFDLEEDFGESLEVLLSLPAAAELSLNEFLDLLDTAGWIEFGVPLLVERVMSAFGPQLTAHAVEVSCKALLDLQSSYRHGYDTEDDVMLFLNTPAAQQLTGDQVGRLVEMAAMHQQYGSLRQLLRLPSAAAIEPETLKTSIEELMDPMQRSQLLLEEIRELLGRVPLGAKLQMVELMQVKCDWQHGFCLNVQQEDEDECHYCLLLHSVASAAMGAAAAAGVGHGQGVNAGDGELNYAAVADLPVGKKVMLLKQAVHHHWFGELLSALPADGEGSREALAPQLQGILFEAFKEVLGTDGSTLGAEEKEAALKHLLKQKESDLLSKGQVQHLLRVGALNGLGDRGHVLLMEGLTAARELPHY